MDKMRLVQRALQCKACKLAAIRSKMTSFADNIFIKTRVKLTIAADSCVVEEERIRDYFWIISFTYQVQLTDLKRT